MQEGYGQMYIIYVYARSTISYLTNKIFFRSMYNR